MRYNNSSIKFEQTEDCIVAFCNQKDYDTGKLDAFFEWKKDQNFNLYHIKSNIETKQIYIVLTKNRFSH